MRQLHCLVLLLGSRAAHAETVLSNGWSREGYRQVGAVAGAGDVDGDGYADIAVGDIGDEVVYLYAGGASGASFTEDWTASGTSGSDFGAEVAGVGDVDGDGFAELAVGAPLFADAYADEGAISLYFGAADGLAASAGWSVEGGADGTRLGTRVVGGDFDGDGYSDVATAFDEYLDGYVIAWNGGPLPDTVADWTVTGGTGETLGADLAAADLDGDGYPDLLVGAPGYSDGEAGEGRVVGYSGSAAGLATAASWSWEPDLVDAAAGKGIDAGGDVDGDGYVEVLVGAPGYTNGEAGEGAVFLLAGGAGGFGAVLWTLEGDAAAAGIGAGETFAVVGDTDGDGYADLLVGEPSWDGESGRTRLFAGDASGVDSAAFAWMPSDEAYEQYLGRAVAAGGDVNADGFADVVVAEPGNGVSTALHGAAWMFYGSGEGTSAMGGSDESFELAEPVPYEIASLGDANGDGYEDLAVSESSSSSHHLVYSFEGSADGLVDQGEVIRRQCSHCYLGGAGDLDGDGYAEVATGEWRGAVRVFHGAATGYDVAAVTVIPVPSGASWYFDVPAPAGDVNGDGYGDLLVSDARSDEGGSDAGAVYVFHGGARGVSTAPDATLLGPAPSAYLSSIGGAMTAGDVNGDGFDDVIVGANDYDDGAVTDAGLALLHLGSASGLDSTAAWSVAGGDADAQCGAAVAGLGDVNGDGYDDLAVACGWSMDDNTVDVYFGGSGGPSSTPDWSVAGDLIWGTYGHPVFGGDFDGDGYSDLGIALDGDDAHPQYEGLGQAAIWRGGPTGFDTEPTWRIVDAVRLTQLKGFTPAGDVDGNGRDTIVALSFETPYEQVRLTRWELPDADGDGVVAGPDCDDQDADVYEGATDDCDGVDSDCDGTLDEDGSRAWYADADGDGYGAGPVTSTACTAAAGEVANAVDCDDTDALVSPDGRELCDGVDQDCDGVVDDDAQDAPTWYADADGDGLGDATVATRSCVAPAGYVADGTDCDDTDPTDACARTDTGGEGSDSPEATEKSGCATVGDTPGTPSAAALVAFVVVLRRRWRIARPRG